MFSKQSGTISVNPTPMYSLGTVRMLLFITTTPIYGDKTPAFSIPPGSNNKTILMKRILSERLGVDVQLVRQRNISATALSKKGTSRQSAALMSHIEKQSAKWWTGICITIPSPEQDRKISAHILDEINGSF